MKERSMSDMIHSFLLVFPISKCTPCLKSLMKLRRFDLSALDEHFDYEHRHAKGISDKHSYAVAQVLVLCLHYELHSWN